MMSRPSLRTQRAYGVSFSVANFFANSSGTIASLAMECSCTCTNGIGFAWTASSSRPRSDAAPALSGLLDLPREILLDEIRVEHDLGVVLRRVLQLLEVVQSAIFVNAVGRGDESRGTLWIRVEMLMDRVGWYVDHVPRFPLVALHFRLWLPVVGVGNLHVAVLVQVVTAAFHDVQALLGEVVVLPRSDPERNDLHVSVHRFNARVHLLVQQMLEQALPGHLPRHLFRMHDLLALGVAHRLIQRVVQQRLIQLSARRPAHPSFRFTPGHVFAPSLLHFA